MRKNVRIKILFGIWCVKRLKNWLGQGCIFQAIFPAHYTFLVKVFLIKLKNLYTSACLKLNYGTTKHKPKM